MSVAVRHHRFVISGEMTLGPMTVVGAIGFLGSMISTIWVGWSLRSGSSSREERRTDSSVHRAR